MKLKNYILFFCMSLLLFACSNESEDNFGSSGYLSLSDIRLVCDGMVIPLTKAVDEKLRIEVWQNGTLVPGQTYEPGSIPDKIILASGVYVLKAFTPGYREEAEEGYPGSATYYYEYSFTITTGNLLTITLDIPMSNIGVGISLSDSFSEAFATYRIVFQTTTRSFEITQENKDDLFFFNLPENERLTYQISVVNADGESMGPLERTIKVEAGKLYTVQVSFDNLLR